MYIYYIWSYYSSYEPFGPSQGTNRAWFNLTACPQPTRIHPARPRHPTCRRPLTLSSMRCRPPACKLFARTSRPSRPCLLTVNIAGPALSTFHVDSPGQIHHIKTLVFACVVPMVRACRESVSHLANSHYQLGLGLGLERSDQKPLVDNVAACTGFPHRIRQHCTSLRLASTAKTNVPHPLR
jgi:hypothetical protein